MQPYPKIETLFDRAGDFRVDVDQLRRPVYGAISSWVVTEKIDGTNIRIAFETSNPNEYEPEITVLGKTDNASIPPKLLSHCLALGRGVAAHVTEIMQNHTLTDYILYGEGYGPKIQNGGRYREDQGFILFDIGVGTGRYLSDDQVTATAEKLDIPRVPIIGDDMTLDDIVGLVRGGFPSDSAEKWDKDFLAEGVVARTFEPLYDNRGERLIVKLKTKDFKAGRR